MANGIHLVWFKRDLRTTDHPPLLAAHKASAVLPLYVWEDAFWQQPDNDAQHAAFIQKCLADLDQQLSALGCPLQQTSGNFIDILNHLHQTIGIATLCKNSKHSRICKRIICILH